MVQIKGEYFQLQGQVLSPTSPTSPTPRFRTSTSQTPDSNHFPSFTSAPPSPERVPRVLRRRSTRWSFAPCPSSFLRPGLLPTLPIPLFLFVTLILRWAHATWELHLMLDFYPRRWWAQPLKPIPPLRGCFDASGPLYNLSERFFGGARRHADVQAGMLLSLSAWTVTSLPAPLRAHPQRRRRRTGRIFTRFGRRGGHRLESAKRPRSYRFWRRNRERGPASCCGLSGERC